MKLTKEIKLENPKRCDGCPYLSGYIFGIPVHCVLKYKTKIRQYTLSIGSLYNYTERPQSCILENGE